jgi:hypothetical protein
LFSETFTERDLPLLDKAKAMGFDAIDIVPFDLERFPAKQVRNAPQISGSISSTRFALENRGFYRVSG